MTKRAEIECTTPCTVLGSKHRTPGLCTCIFGDLLARFPRQLLCRPLFQGRQPFLVPLKESQDPPKRRRNRERVGNSLDLRSRRVPHHVESSSWRPSRYRPCNVIDWLYFTKDGEIEEVQVIEKGVEARALVPLSTRRLCLETSRRVSGVGFACSVMFQIPIRLKISETPNQYAGGAPLLHRHSTPWTARKAVRWLPRIIVPSTSEQLVIQILIGIILRIVVNITRFLRSRYLSTPLSVHLTLLFLTLILCQGRKPILLFLLIIIRKNILLLHTRTGRTSTRAPRTRRNNRKRALKPTLLETPTRLLPCTHTRAILRPLARRRRNNHQPSLLVGLPLSASSAFRGVRVAR